MQSSGKTLEIACVSHETDPGIAFIPVGEHKVLLNDAASQMFNA
jgi:hypothetical protein